MATTTNIAFYWNPGEALASHESSLLPVPGRRNEDDAIEYRFDETSAFYLRLIPTAPLSEPFQVAQLQDIVGRRRADVLTRTAFGSFPSRNRFGAIAYEPLGSSTTPTAFTQLFRNGELWGVTRELVGHHHNKPSAPMTNVQDIYGRVLKNYIDVAEEELGFTPPFQIEMGAIGLNGLRLSLPQSRRKWLHELSEPIVEFSAAVPNGFRGYEHLRAGRSHPELCEKALRSRERHPLSSAAEMLSLHDAPALRERSALFNAIMYGQGGLPRAERELGAAVESILNGCVYCTSVHARFYIQLAKRPDVIDRLFADGVGAELEPRQRAIADFSAKLAQTPPQAGAAEIRALRNAGLSDSDIADLADAVAMFAWANRLMLTLGEPKRA